MTKHSSSLSHCGDITNESEIRVPAVCMVNKDKRPLHKLFNRNTVKIGYSCMRNMGSIIKQPQPKNPKDAKQYQQ